MRTNYRKIILGLPIPEGLPVACHWSLSNLRRLDSNTVEIHNFNTLVVELVRNEDPYLTLIHSGLLNLSDTSHAHQALIVSLAKRFKNCGYRIWDPKKLWPPCDDMPPNLIVWTNEYTSEIEHLILSEMEVWH